MKLKVFNLNCWLLPPPFSHDNGKRLRKIIDTIKREKPDLISLQEVWLNKYVKKLQRELSSYNFITSDSFVVNRSGLVTGLRLDHKSEDIQTFHSAYNYNWWGRIIKKGYHLMELSEDFYFVNAHVHDFRSSYFASEGVSLRDSQFETLQENLEGKKAIVTGDLNLNQEDLKELNKLFDFEEEDVVTYSSENPYTGSIFHEEEDHKLDYIIATDKSDIDIKTECLKTPLMSDHYALLGEVKVE